MQVPLPSLPVPSPFRTVPLWSLLCHWPKPPILPCLSDDLASKANIVIDPLELQAATMDDLDEDEEPAPTAAQVWQYGQAVGFSFICRQGYDTGLASLHVGKDLLTREVPWLQVEA